MSRLVTRVTSDPKPSSGGSRMREEELALAGMALDGLEIWEREVELQSEEPH